MENFFHKFSKKAADIVGSAKSFLFAILFVLIWLFSGPYFHYSDTLQLIINTGTAVITFLVVFLIQNTQNRQSETLELKIDELIKALKKARNSLIDLEELSDDELKKLHEQFKRFSDKEKIKE